MKKHDLTCVRVGVIIATKGRPKAIPHILRLLDAQTLRPHIVVVSAHEQADIGLLDHLGLNLQCLFGPAGLTRQRNLGIQMILNETDIIVFFDDDFAPSRFWIERCIDVFKSDENIVGLSGMVLKDGAASEDEVTWDQAKNIIDRYTVSAFSDALVSPHFTLYGCNMALRSSAIGTLRFDERLVLYGWMEDKDFSVRMAARGRLVQSNVIHGVHLGLRGGRVSGKKFGYSQIINPWYLRQKGVLSTNQALRNTLKAFVMNFAKSFRPESQIDRRGRLFGNLIGLLELVSGKCRPERAAEL